MRVRIQDFGPVSDFLFDTEKSFHLIVGDNNVGKSYALTAYYFIVKTIIGLFSDSMYPMHRFFYYGNIDNGTDALTEEENKIFLSKLQSKKVGDLDIEDIYNSLAIDFLQQTLAEEFSSKIKSSYSEHVSIANSFTNAEVAKITISLSTLEVILEGNIDEFKVVSANYIHKPVLRSSKQNRQPTIANGKLVIYRHADESAETLITKIKLQSITRCTTAMRSAIEGVLDIDYLPASRSGLYQALSAFGQIIAELSRSRSFLSAKIELPGISGQLSDYFIKLNSIKAIDSNLDQEFSDVAEAIETSVLKGEIEYDYKDKRLYYKPIGTNLRLELSATSSMVSETAPIVAYIRHIIAWKPSLQKRPKRTRVNIGKPTKLKKILIIEEPEAHLHPLNQIRMTEIYADLAKIGVNIIMTSHSNYVFNKLSNLVIEKKLDVQDVQCDLFKMLPTGSVGESQCIDEFGIDDKNFTDASESLFNERIELIGSMEA